MSEKPTLSVEVEESSPIRKLYEYIQSLPRNQGIQGQVQIEVSGTEAKIFQESALYGTRLVITESGEEQIEIKAADAKGMIRTYRSVGDRIDRVDVFRFVDVTATEDGLLYKSIEPPTLTVHFPGFH